MASGELDAARRELTERVMGRPGIEGTAVGEQRGKPCLKVYVSDRSAAAKVPREIRGYPVVVENSGRVRPRS